MSIFNKTNNSINERIAFVDGLFVFAMILVVVGHSGLAPDFHKTYLYKWIYSFHMPIFFWLSGYLLNLHKGKVHESYFCFLKKKASRLLIPLITLTTLVYYPKVLLSEFAVRPAEGSFKGFINAFLYPVENPIQPLWFLTVLFIIYAVGYWIRYFCKSSMCRLAMTFVLSLALEFVIVNLKLDLKFLYISQVFYQMPFFILGMMMSNNSWIKSWMFNSVMMTILTFAVLSLSVHFQFIFSFSPIVNLCWKYFNAVVGIWFSASFIICLGDKGVRFIPQLRNYTFCIYLLQWFTMTPLRAVYNMFNGFGISSMLWCVAIFLSGLFLPFLIGVFVNRNLSHKGFARYMRMMIGL